MMFVMINLECFICKYVENIICMGIIYIFLYFDIVDFFCDVLVYVCIMFFYFVYINVFVGFSSLNG